MGTGYDPGFLRAAVELPCPDRPTILLDYTHFSVRIVPARRLAAVVGVNINGRELVPLDRIGIWHFDPRVPRSVQAGPEVYRHNDLDRGHLVRRLDPAWGSSRPAAKSANDDTFHFTNCSPQHKNFNQNQTTWAGLEDYILKNADLEDLKVTVFTGPVLAGDDPEYRGVKIPRQFWKVVVIARAGGLSATAYLLSQKDLVDDIHEDFQYGAYRTFQVPVREIETLTGLDFNGLTASDPLHADEVLEGTHLGRREILTFAQIQL